MAGYTLLTVGKVGDFNGDGVVNGTDFLAWQRNPSLGELADWQEVYRQSLATQAEAAAVPEPVGVPLLLGLTVTLAALRDDAATGFRGL